MVVTQQFDNFKMRPGETMTEFDARFSKIVTTLAILGKTYNNIEVSIKLDNFKMRPGETMTEFDARFSKIVTTLAILDKTYNNREVTIKVMCALPREWDIKTMAMRESKDLNMMELFDLLVDLKAYERKRLKQEIIECAHLASTSRDKGKKRKNVDAAQGPNAKKKVNNDCFFCNKVGHLKKNCTKYHAWREKKGTFLNLVYSEVNLASILGNTWWLDSGATTNISISIQGFLSYRKPSDAERRISVGDGKSTKVEAIEHFRLLLSSSFYLDLKDTFIVPSFKRNLVSIRYLDKHGYLVCLEMVNLSYLLAQILDVFKSFKVEVENQPNKKIKKVKFDHGGEYYGRYDGSCEQRPGPFAKYLE
ncbi:uncharacterized protein LOC124922058 [Impatiens glandulifera]|uniref:uncharacterized protein LOC124922058 n=1 Tax=Impatiens glandulifera TaxID=253017 RepID=UPI001FB0ADF0|nr:uncharacterized protein LOC124922058 [Impatiens glandulifera]